MGRVPCAVTYRPAFVCLCMRVYVRARARMPACLCWDGKWREMPAAASLAEPSAAQLGWPVPLSAPWPHRPRLVAPVQCSAVQCSAVRSKRAACLGSGKGRTQPRSLRDRDEQYCAHRKARRNRARRLIPISPSPSHLTCTRPSETRAQACEHSLTVARSITSIDLLS